MCVYGCNFSNNSIINLYLTVILKSDPHCNIFTFYRSCRWVIKFAKEIFCNDSLSLSMKDSIQFHWVCLWNIPQSVIEFVYKIHVFYKDSLSLSMKYFIKIHWVCLWNISWFTGFVDKIFHNNSLSFFMKYLKINALSYCRTSSKFKFWSKIYCFKLWTSWIAFWNLLLVNMLPWGLTFVENLLKVI